VSSKEAAEILRATQALLVLRVSPSPFVEALEAGAAALEAGPITKHTSDGFHTFEELYEHRFELWMALCRVRAEDPEDHTEIWRCKLNSDGSSWPGWFLLGTDSPKQISYHLPIRLWDRCAGFAVTYDEPHAWDGHTSADVLERLKEL